MESSIPRTQHWHFWLRKLGWISLTFRLSLFSDCCVFVSLTCLSIRSGSSWHFLYIFQSCAAPLLFLWRRMHRSLSTTRASDEFLVNLLPTDIGSPPPLKAAASDDLPMYNSISDSTSKKDIAPQQSSSGENAVHLIPLVLVLCGFVLWIFSSTGKVWWISHICM